MSGSSGKFLIERVLSQQGPSTDKGSASNALHVLYCKKQ